MGSSCGYPVIPMVWHFAMVAAWNCRRIVSAASHTCNTSVIYEGLTFMSGGSCGFFFVLRRGSIPRYLMFTAKLQGQHLRVTV
jgi:hypothetical protein